MMPYRLLCSDVQRENSKLSPDLASGLFCYVHYTKFGMVSLSIATIIIGVSGEFSKSYAFCMPNILLLYLQRWTYGKSSVAVKSTVILGRETCKAAWEGESRGRAW